MTTRIHDTQNGQRPAEQLLQRAKRARRTPFETIGQRRKRIKASMRPTLPSAKTTYQNDVKLLELSRVDALRYQHCMTLAHLAVKLGIAYNVPNKLNAGTIYKVFSAHNWTCPKTRTEHSEFYPLTLDFVIPLDCGGLLAASNLKPQFIPFLIAGDYPIQRSEPTFKPSHQQPMLAVLGA